MHVEPRPWPVWPFPFNVSRSEFFNDLCSPIAHSYGVAGSPVVPMIKIGEVTEDVNGGAGLLCLGKYLQALPLNEISQPIRSPFGWHLIVVNERRNGSVADRERIAARNVIRERKIEEQAQEWLRRLRDKTFVELRLD